jgi:hypothetical protein
VRFISTDPGEFGVIGVGQEAHGFFAFGQFAKGVIAVGQIAIGVVAIGQVSFSIAGVGQVGGAVTWFAGMVGLGGRGFCIRLIPGLDLPRDPPPEVALDAVWQGNASGYVRLGVADTPHGPALTATDGSGAVLPIKLRPPVAWALANALRTTTLREVYADLRRDGDSLICRALVEVPGQRSPSIGWLNVLRFLALVGVATLWCALFTEYVLGPAFR